MGIAAALLIGALLAACTSDQEQPQIEQPQQEQPEPPEQAEQPQQPDQDARQSAQPQAQTRQRTQDNAGDGEDEVEERADEPQAQPAAADAQQSDDEQRASGTQAERQQEAQPEEQEPSAQEDQGQSDQSQQTQDETADQPAETSAQEEQPEPQQTDQQAGTSEPDPPDEPAQPSERERLRMRADEIAAQASVTDLVGLNGWLNGEETTIALELARGNVVLVDFWTYTCINCVRTLPFLTAWDAKYRDHGLVILGVHTPEFEFEKDPDNIRAAIAEHGIEYHVPMDNDYRTWRAFNNRYWPAKYLIGPTDDSPMGVRYFHFGEGHYEESERAIRQALEAVGLDISDVPFGVDVAVPDRSGVARGRQTRELYGGWRRNTGGGGPYAGQEAYFLAGLDAEHLYRDVESDQREHNRWYLEGLWRAEFQAIAHARTTENLEDYLALLIRGRTVNVVLTVAANGQPYDVYVQFNDDWIRDEFAGEHIRWDDQGRSYIRVDENDLYRLVFFREFTEGELKLSSNSDQFRMFAFTFGSYVGGE